MATEYRNPSIHHEKCTVMSYKVMTDISDAFVERIRANIGSDALTHFTIKQKRNIERQIAVGKELNNRTINGILTVAGEATSKSMGSKIKLVVFANWMISPLFKQS